MAIEIKLPNLGDGIDSADILSVLVGEGDVIAKDQNVVEVETDKATAEVPTNAGGKVAKIHVSAGETISVGTVLLTLESADAADAPAPAASPTKSPARLKPISMTPWK